MNWIKMYVSNKLLVDTVARDYLITSVIQGEIDAPPEESNFEGKPATFKLHHVISERLGTTLCFCDEKGIEWRGVEFDEIMGKLAELELVLEA